MKTVKTVSELSKWLKKEFINDRSLGFVPTMGALHAGHLSLLKRSVKENDITACSIFVNPIQFNNPEDLTEYPRMPHKDASMLEENNCDLLFIPSVEEMYPDDNYKKYDFGSLENIMEGAFRPGHFNGVAVVVDRLLRLLKPSKAYFGLKDYQQFLIISEMVKQEGHKVELIGCPTVREDDGLAMSSRNLRLNEKQRKDASKIYDALIFAKNNHDKYSVKELKDIIIKKLNNIPDSKVEYVEFADPQTLQPKSSFAGENGSILCVALFIGNIRLIDNMKLCR